MKNTLKSDIKLIEKMFNVDISERSFLQNDLKKYFFVEKTKDGFKYNFQLENGPCSIEVSSGQDVFRPCENFKNFLINRRIVE